MLNKIKYRVISSLLITSLFVGLLPANIFASENIQTANIETVNKIKKVRKIIGEDKEKREINVKTFLNDDLSYTSAIYPYSVHYKNGDRFEDIDNTLTSEKDENGGEVLTNKANDFKIKIAKNCEASNLVKIQKDKYELSWGLEKFQRSIAEVEEKELDDKNLSENDKKISLPNISSSVNFKSVFTDTDIKYNINSNSVREYIVINEKNDEKKEYKFNMNVKNLKASLLKDNSIELYDENDTSKKIFTIAAPYMYDKNGESSKDISVVFEETERGYMLTIKPNESWINSSDRVYPITIDPDVITQISTATIDDTYVSQIDGNTNFATENLLVQNSTSNSKKYSFIKFAMPTILTSADIITNATLCLNSTMSTSGEVDVFKVNGSWSEDTLTWNSMPSCDPNVLDYSYINSGSVCSWDITKVVNEWCSSSQTNNGVVLKYANEGIYNYSSFFNSSEISQIMYRPYILINYTNNAGLESYWTYHSKDFGRAGTVYVNDASGNATIVHGDFSLNGNRMPISLKHIYNTSYKSINEGFGYGWSLNLKQTLTFSNINGIQYYIYKDEDGTKHYFQDYGAGYIDESGLNLSLTVNSDSTKIIKDKADNILKFDSAGKLVKITDNKGNSLNIGYAGSNITTVTDAANRQAKLNYDANGNLQNIEYPVGTVKVSYGYVSNELRTITYVDNKQSTYTYESDHRIKSTMDHTGYKLSYAYNSNPPYKLRTITETNASSVGQMTVIDYKTGQTTFTPYYPLYNKMNSVYQYNSYGNTTSQIDNMKDAVYYQYEDVNDMANRNKIKLESKRQIPIMNKVSDSGSFGTTDNGYWTVYNPNNVTGTTNSGSTVENKYFGVGAFKVTKTSTGNGRYGFIQNYSPGSPNWAYATSLKKGKKYTLSGFIKTDGISKQSSSNSGACISVKYTDNSGNIVIKDSKFVIGTTDWQRVDTAFETPPIDSTQDITVYVMMTISDETGTAYFDNIQIEDGSALNSYNCIENPDMTYVDTANDVPWYMSRGTGCESRDGAYTYPDGDSYPSNLDKSCFRIYGVTNMQKSLSSTINAGSNGKAGDVFSAGCWTKADSAPVTKMSGPITSSDRAFGLEVKFMNGSTVVNSEYFPCNPYTNDWQFVCGRAQAVGDYTSIVTTAMYYNNINVAYFDGFQIYKEEFGVTYNHDANGNVISVTGLNQDKTTMNYNSSNDVTSEISPLGSETKTGYINHNPNSVTSPENITSETAYDSFFNPRRTVMSDGVNSIKSLSEYDSTNNYLKTQVDQLGRYTNYNFDAANGKLNSVSQLENVTGSVYSSTTYGYDSLNRLISASKPVSGIGTVQDQYSTIDGNGNETDNLTKITHNGFNYSFGYDLLRNLNTISVGTQPLITYNYDPNTSRLNGLTYGNGDVIGFDYNENNEVIAKKYNNVVRYKYAYDGNGNLSYYENRADLPNNSASKKNYRYQYDTSGRTTNVTEYADTTTNTTNYVYDLENNLGRTEEFINNGSYSTGHLYDKSGTEKQTYINTLSKNDGSVEYFSFNNNFKGSLGTNPTSKNASFENDEYNIPMLASFQGTTNLLSTNTSFENGLTGWQVGTGSTVRTAYDGVDGNQCLEIYNQNQGSAVESQVSQKYISSTALSTSNKFIVSVQLKNLTFGVLGSSSKIRVVPLNSSGSEKTSEAKETNLIIGRDKQWARISTEPFLVSENTYGINVYIIGSVSGKQLLRIDNVQLELKEFATPYTSSTSTGSSLQYKIPTLTKNSGTFGAWFNLMSTGPIASGDKWYLFSNELKSGSNIIANLSAYIDNGKHLVVEAKNTSGTTNSVTSTHTIASSNIRSPLEAAFNWYFMALTWSYQNGSLIGTLYVKDKFGTTTNTPINISNIANFDNANTSIGCDTSGNNQLNGLIGVVAYSKNALSSTEISNMYNAGRTASINNTYDNFGRAKDTSIFTGNAGSSNDVFYKIQYEGYQNNKTDSGTTTLLNRMSYGISNSGAAKTLVYEYDIKGNITLIQEQPSNQKITYKYNELNELVRENNPYINKTIIYSYDQGGNIVDKKEYNLLEPDVEPTGNPVATLNYTYDSVWKDKMTGYDGKTFDYDNIGNLRHIYKEANTLYTYNWEEGRNLASISGSGLSTSYKYNDSGVRTEKTVGGITTVYHLDGDKVTYEDNGTDKIYYRYDASGKLVSMNLNGSEYFYIRNGQGDIITLVDKSGVEVAKYSYDSWGKLLSIKDQNGTDITTNTTKVGYKNPYRYRGYRYDNETGLYYLQTRYYNPEWGRFINSDGIVGRQGKLLSHNMFAYCRNNPVNYYDPDGKEEQSVKSNSLPKKGEPNSKKKLYDKDGKLKQEREYGPDGEPVEDTDYSHGGTGHVFPHKHKWKNGVRQPGVPVPQPNPAPAPTPNPSANFSHSRGISSSNVGKAAGGAAIGTIIYWIVSEGLRIFPPRNLVPIP